MGRGALGSIEAAAVAEKRQKRAVANKQGWFGKLFRRGQAEKDAQAASAAAASAEDEVYLDDIALGEAQRSALANSVDLSQIVASTQLPPHCVKLRLRLHLRGGVVRMIGDARDDTAKAQQLLRIELGATEAVFDLLGAGWAADASLASVHVSTSCDAGAGTDVLETIGSMNEAGQLGKDRAEKCAVERCASGGDSEEDDDFLWKPAEVV